MRKTAFSFLLGAVAMALPIAAHAGDAWWSGDWYLKIGAEGFVAPRYEGAKSYLLQAQPLISLGKVGQVVRFSSRNDNPSFSLYDNGAVRIGLVGKLIMQRDGDTSSDLKGLKPIPFGLEAGVFGEVYPTDWIRVRAEIRHGIHSYDGNVADISADAFTDVTPTIRVSAGPRLTFASNQYMDAYYKVNARQSKKSGLSEFNPDAGLESAGFGGAVTWQATDKIESSAFAEYKRLIGDAGDSSLVSERGSRNQFVVGLSTTYKFGFTLP